MSLPSARLVQLTDALLAAARASMPDLELIARLLGERGQLLADLPPAPAAEREPRRALLLGLQAADAELRARLVERHAVVRDQLVILARRGPTPSRGLRRRGYIDREA